MPMWTAHLWFKACLIAPCREVLASPELLNMPERVDWKVCSITKQQEISHAATFKDTFKKYDFNLED